MSDIKENTYSDIPGEKLISGSYTKTGTAAAGSKSTFENPRMSSVFIKVCLLVLFIAIVVTAVTVVIVGAVSGAQDRDLRTEIDMLKTSFSGIQQQVANPTSETGTYVSTWA